jgi:DNA sulfur modification protein DndC
MKVEQQNLFTGKRLQMNESIELTIQSIMAYGHSFNHWCIAWSGGKDSSTLLTLVVWLINSERIQRPKTLTVMYADTRMELSPLWFAAKEIISELKELGIEVIIVMAPIEKRFLPYILGRGVPPPNNATFRWCTRQIKVDPMEDALTDLFKNINEKILMLTGVRQGESAIRDQRIMMSCGKDGAECGQGWYQEAMPSDVCATLAPILHWRVCHVWEWLKHWAPLPEYGEFSTAIIAEAYGGDEAEEKNARTGCVGCPLTDKDTALDSVVKIEKWAYIAPLKRLRPIYRWMRHGSNRLRKTGDQKNEKNVQRMGPLTIDARRKAFDMILAIQNDINEAAERLRRPKIDILNPEEQAFIKDCWAKNIWPNRWDGSEPRADELIDTKFKDGTKWPVLFGQ